MTSYLSQPCSLCKPENGQKPKSGIHSCHGCTLSFCSIHINDHRHELNTKFDSIMKENQAFQLTLNKDENNVQCLLKKVDLWEYNMHELINRTAEQYRSNIRLNFDNQLNKIKEDCRKFNAELIEKQEYENFFENDIQQLSLQLEQLKANFQQLYADFQLDQLDVTKLNNENEQKQSLVNFTNNSNLLLKRQAISLHDRNCFFLAVSNEHILAYILSVNRNENRLVLYNIDDNTELHSNQLDARYGNACDIVYADKLNQCFLVVCRQAIFIYDPKQKTLTRMPDVVSMDRYPFWSIAVSPNTNDTFISFGSHGFIEQWSTEAHPKWRLITRWSMNDFLQEFDLGVRMLRVCHTKNQLAMTVLEREDHCRIDLFDFQMNLIRRGEKLSIPRDKDKPGFGCRLLMMPDENNQEWLLTERTTNSLWHVNGSIARQIDKNVNCACLIINDAEPKRIVVSYSNEPKRIEIYSFSD